MKTLIELVAAHATCCWGDGANDMDHPNTDKARAALVAGIEALQSEIQNWQKAIRAISVLNKSLAAERDSLQAEVDALKAQEPVKAIHQVYMDYGWKDMPAAEMWMYTPEQGWDQHYVRTVYTHAAPQAPAPEAK
jgi:FtsZ-binding cell division protein ZapB